MPNEYVYQEEDIGKRIVYTDRKDKQHPGVIRGVIPSVKMVDVQLDEHYASRERYYVPTFRVAFEEQDNAASTE